MSKTLTFKVGDVVIERFGEGPDAPAEESLVIDVKGERCQTESGLWYDRLTGKLCEGQGIGGYQAIHSAAYRRMKAAPLKGGTD